MKKEITYLSNSPDETGEMIYKEVTKVVEWKELSRVDPTQHILVADAYSLFSSSNKKSQLNGEVLMNIIKNAIDVLIVEDKDCNKVDKQEMKNDVGCILYIQSWFSELYLDFFLSIMKK